MTTSNKLTVFVVLGVLTILGLSIMNNEPAPPHRVDTVRIRVVSEAKAEAAATTQAVVSVRPLRDSVKALLNLLKTQGVDTITDSVRVEVEKYIDRVDTVFAQCERCARKLDSLARWADSALKAKDDTIAKRNRQLAATKKRGHLEAALAFVGGVFVAR